MPTIAVYCGSRTGADPRFAAAAERLGDLMAERGIDLVYGGGQVGLMGLIARRVLAGGRKVIGVIPELLSAAEIVFQDATELILVETMHQRKWLMAERADAFLVLPGGFGTFDEMFEVAAWAQLRIHEKPLAVWDVAGFYAGLFDWLHERRRTRLSHTRPNLKLLRTHRRRGAVPRRDGRRMKNRETRSQKVNCFTSGNTSRSVFSCGDD